MDSEKDLDLILCDSGLPNATVPQLQDFFDDLENTECIPPRPPLVLKPSKLNPEVWPPKRPDNTTNTCPDTQCANVAERKNHHKNKYPSKVHNSSEFFSSSNTKESHAQSLGTTVSSSTTSHVRITGTLLPGAQGCNELVYFVQTVESLVKRNSLSVDEALLLPSTEVTQQANIELNDGWVYDVTYGTLTGHERNQTNDPDKHFWGSKTVTSMVAHLAPIPAKTDKIEAETPTHSVNTSKWPIPELRLSVMIYLTNDHWYTNNDIDKNGSNPVTVSSNGRKVQLVCDPDSTLVKELMSKALSKLENGSQVDLTTDHYQLRILGRAELLHRNAFLSQCDYVQVCYRRDLPLEFALEPRRTYQEALDLRLSVCQKPFTPPSTINANHKHSIEEAIAGCSHFLETAITKIERTIVLNNDEVLVGQWRSETKGILITLTQSLKALVTTACCGVVFSTVLDSLEEVIRAIQEIRNLVSNRSTKSQSSGASSLDVQSTFVVPDSKTSENSKTSPETVSLAQVVKQQPRLQLRKALRKLQIALLIQLKSVFDWQQLGMKVIHTTPAQLPNRQKEGGRRPNRPVGLIMDNTSLASEDASQPTALTSGCTETLLIEVVSVYNLPSSLQMPKRPSPNSPGGLSSSDNLQSGFDSQLRIRIGLTYAGRRLSSILSPTDSEGRGASATDTHMSDTGRYRPQRHGLPELLHFTQLFRFPSFPISRLPREVLLTVALFSGKNIASENIETDGVLIGWVNIPLFTPTGCLRQGSILAGLWPPLVAMGPYRPVWTQANNYSDQPIVHIRLPILDHPLAFPKIDPDNNPLPGNDSARLRKPTVGLSGDAQNAAQFAARSIFMHSLDPAMSKADADRAVTFYCSAASASHRRSSQKSALSGIHLSALSLMSTAGFASLQTENVHAPYNLDVGGSVPSVAVLSPQNVAAGSSSSSSGSSSKTLPISQYLTTWPLPIAVDVLWHLRWYSTVNNPNALAALLIGVLTCWPDEARGSRRQRSAWNWDRLLSEVYSLLAVSPSPSPVWALRLLAGDVPDQGIRHWAVRGLAFLPSDALLLYLPQVLEVLQYDLYLDYSGIVSLLLYSADSSFRFANALFWQLNLAMDGHNTSQSFASPLVRLRYRRFALIKSALEWLVSDRLRATWKCQDTVTEMLSTTALAVRKSRADTNTRVNVLVQNLSQFPDCLKTDSQPTVSLQPLLIDLGDSTAIPSVFDSGFRLPYNPGLLVHQINLSACSYFTSFTSPLRLSFKSMDNSRDPIMVMFKTGDDLRLDSMISQITLLMDRIWLNAGLDLRMVHFNILPTEFRQGYIELVPKCSTLREIQQQGGGLTGAFKDSVITAWLQSQSTTEVEYKRALDNFLRSLAGFSVATYVLGVGDRHNDNILIQTTGHLFHVDFAKVFGQVQTFAGIKRDRVPFVLTPDMLHVLQAYSTENSRTATSVASKSANSREGMQMFIELCCQAFNLLRRNAQDIIFMLELCLPMDIPDFSKDSIQHVRRALHLEYNDQRATQHFTHMIHKTTQSKASSLNFFVHGLAQSKQPSTNNLDTAVSASVAQIQTDSARSPSVGKHSPAGLKDRSSPVPSFQDVISPSTSSPGASPSDHKDQLLSFIPKKFKLESDNKIEKVVVERATKMKDFEKSSEYFFPIDVWRRNSQGSIRIYRKMAEIFEFLTVLIGWFPSHPINGQIMTAMCELSILSETSLDSPGRLQNLIDCILYKDPNISECDLVYTFFQSVFTDKKHSREDPKFSEQQRKEASLSEDHVVNDSDCYVTSASQWPAVTASQPARNDVRQTPYIGQPEPALQVEVCLNESLTQLDILIKHGRNLLIPGSLDLPDVYVKVYLIYSKRHQEQKKKTNIIRRTSEPSFNTSFTYMISPVIAEKCYLEISAWHAERLGGNLLLGKFCLPLRTLKPGQCLAKWYDLTDSVVLV